MSRPVLPVSGSHLKYLVEVASSIIFLTLLSFPLYAQSPPETARYVWSDADGYGRFKVAFFRYELDLEAVPEAATFSLFADSRYHLLVNGHYVNFGPSRFYPQHPRYDTYDLSPWLRTGNNVIAVKVVSNGTHSFQLRRQPPGLIGWGRVGEHDLTTPGNWKVYRSQGYDEQAPKLTFATGPMELYDARPDKDVLGWEQPGFDASAWSKAVPIGRQEAWGPLAARTIPPLTQEAFGPRRLIGVYTLANDEAIISFRVKTPDTTRANYRRDYTLFGYTYIFSPQAQQVEAGIWWGEHFLNGDGPIEPSAAGPDHPHRQRMTLDLQKGWNYFFIKRKSFWGKWDFFLAVPREAGLLFSPDRQKDDAVIFKTAGPFHEEEEARLNALPLPFDPAALPQDLSDGWGGHLAIDDAGNPAVEMAWRPLGKAVDVPSWKTDGIWIDHQDGIALVYDFRYKKLGRIVVEYDAPEGTVIDVGFTEDLIGKKVNVMKRVGLYMATRHITAGGPGRLETLKPYGLRYLQINIRNNTGPVQIKEVKVVNQVYPFEKTGSFECSDPLFNAIWEVGWRTIRVCAEDSYTDTPFRERGLYAGDMLPQMGVTLAGSTDLRLIKYSLRLFQDMYADVFDPEVERYPSEIGLLEDYPLLTLEALSWYVDRTGDLDFAAALYPNYDRLIRRLMSEREADGLIHNERVFIEWTQIQKSEVKNTAYHAILARCCQLMDRLAGKLGKPRDQKTYKTYYSVLKSEVRDHFWNPAKELYSDGVKDGEQIDHYYPISSLWPFLANITDERQNKSIFPYVEEVLKDIGSENRRRMTTPYGGFYLLGALYERGLPGTAERFMRQYWSPMVYDHEDTAWENFGSEGIGTLSHAWSAAPTYYLTTRVLGIDLGWPKPFEEKKVTIAPQAESITWARGVVPHPKGPISICWQDRGDHLWVEVKVPVGLDWQVAPKGKLSGKPLWVNGTRVEP